jgi:predicted phosphodiesterase
MRYGILGDIHANLSALEAVLRCFEQEGVDKILSVGDVVGYGAAPRQCIALVREVGATVVKGNHDAAAIGELDTTFFNPHAKAATEWTSGQLSKQDMAWIENLPLIANLSECSVAHGTFHEPEHYDYIQSTQDADASLDLMDLPVCFVGHTHVPVVIMRMTDDPTRTAYTIDYEVDLSDSARALVNVGSVGQPRDEDSRAAYCVYDAEQATVSIGRAKYDIEREAARIRSAGLPGILADRLFLGV